MKYIRDILVASDLGPASEVVMRSAAALAALTGSRLHVLNVHEYQALPYLPVATFSEDIDRLREMLQEQIERTVGVEIEVTTHVVVDIATRAILEHAEQVGADLIVIGRHRQSEASDPFLGGTADNVVRAAQVPVLIVSGAFNAPLRRILVPIDLSEPALHALDIAVRWVSSIGPAESTPEIIVLHIVPRVFDFKDLPLDTMAVIESLHDEIEASRARVGAPSTLDTVGVLRSADNPADEINAFIEHETVDLTILATHGYGAVRRALMGSVSSKVARAASCPVLLVPPLWRRMAEPGDVADILRANQHS